MKPILETLQGTPHNQDFLSMSTQENDSVVSNPPGMSPGASGKKLEWDSGADVGYLNLDLSKENLSTIERIVLKGLSSDGLSEKNVVYEKKGDEPSLKFVLERKATELMIEEIVEISNNKQEIGKSKGNGKIDNEMEKRKKVNQESELQEADYQKPDKKDDGEGFSGGTSKGEQKS